MAERQGWKVLTALYVWAVVVTGALLGLIAYVWEGAPGVGPPEVHPLERTGLAVIGLLGAVGGCVRWMHSLSNSEGVETGRPLWIVESLLVPLKGAALAVPFTLMLRAGIVNPGGVTNGGGVNWIGLYGIAGLTGLFAPEAIDQLERVFGAMFGLARRSDGQSEEERRRE
jgi:hypothetical protein